jgi:hypothetical protein
MKEMVGYFLASRVHIVASKRLGKPYGEVARMMAYYDTGQNTILALDATR